MSDLATIGHNQPPAGVIELVRPVFDEQLRQFLKDYPVIASEDEARAAKLMLDRAVADLKRIDEERKSKVDPLNSQVKAINEEYHQLHNADSKRPGRWNKLVETLRNRLSDWAWAEEHKRREVAELARQAAAEAERLAREAEAREKEAAETAAAGVCDIDIAAATEEADTAFSQFQKASRFAQRAERDTKVRIGGGLGKVSTLRDKEILEVEDAQAALAEIGLTERIKEAILTEARAFRKEMGELPAGIRARYERGL